MPASDVVFQRNMGTDSRENRHFADIRESCGPGGAVYRKRLGARRPPARIHPQDGYFRLEGMAYNMVTLEESARPAQPGFVGVRLRRPPRLVPGLDKREIRRWRVFPRPGHDQGRVLEVTGNRAFIANSRRDARAGLVTSAGPLKTRKQPHWTRAWVED